MLYIEDKNTSLHIRPKEYRDIDIKNLSHIDSFVQKYMRQSMGCKFNTSTDKIRDEYWDSLMSDLVAVYREKWLPLVVNEENKEDIIERVLCKYKNGSRSV